LFIKDTPKTHYKERVKTKFYSKKMIHKKEAMYKFISYNYSRRKNKIAGLIRIVKRMNMKRRNSLFFQTLHRK
jgi:hypothetical protein